MLAPFSEAAKNKADVVAVSGGILAWMKLVPWPEIAGLLSCIYMALRIAEFTVRWYKRKG